MIERNFYFNNLSTPLQSAYTSLYNAIAAHQESTNIGSIDANQFNDIYSAVSMDHPEFAYFAGVFCTLRSDGQVTIPYLNIDTNLYTTKVNQAINEIYAKLHGRSEQALKVKAIFDYLCEHVQYDYEIFNEYAQSTQSGESQPVFEFAQNRAFAFSAYAVFTSGKAMCMGIAKAFKILCDLFGIDCSCIRCNERVGNEEGAPHMLNRICIDGVDTYIDITNSLKITSLPLIRYAFYLCSKEDIEKAFILKDDFPGRRSSHNYFVKYNCDFKEAYYLRNYLATYDALSHNREIRFRYHGDEIKDDEMLDFAVGILNKYAPRGKQWIASYQYGCFSGVMIDEWQVKRIQEEEKKANR